jgi:hypothetical protein
VRLDDKAYTELVEVRVREPSRIAADPARRRRRPTLAPERRAVHHCRRPHGAGGNPHAMLGHRRMLARLALALEHPRVDGVLASADILEALAVLGHDDKVAIGTMNRGGLAGARWALDDRMTAYDAVDGKR